MKNHFAIATPSLLTKDRTSSVTSDEDKRKRWVEHFEGVVNCSTSVSELVLQRLPVISILIDDQLGTPLI